MWRCILYYESWFFCLLLNVIFQHDRFRLQVPFYNFMHTGWALTNFSITLRFFKSLFSSSMIEEHKMMVRIQFRKILFELWEGLTSLACNLRFVHLFICYLLNKTSNKWDIDNNCLSYYQCVIKFLCNI